MLTTLFGKDGTGKSLFMQRVCTALATGKQVLTREQGARVKCLMVMAEDTMPAIMDRQRRINRQLGMTMSDAEGWLIYPDNLMDADVKMVTFDRALRGQKSDFTTALEEYIETHQPELVVLDPISDIYADEENRREKVSQFMRMLNSLAHRKGIAVVLLGHPAKAADSEYSGSGAWSSKSRSRLFMEAVNDKQDAKVILYHRKSSYGSREPEVTLEWEKGVLRDLTASEAEVQHRDDLAEAKDHLLKELRRTSVTCVNVSSDKGSTKKYFPNLLIDAEDGDRSGGFSKNILGRALAELVEQKVLIPNFKFNQPHAPRKKSGNNAAIGLWFNPEFEAEKGGSEAHKTGEAPSHGW